MNEESTIEYRPPSRGRVARRLVVRGRVQGVFFRDFTRRQARELDVAGWVRNRSDGTVEAEVVGSEGALDELERRLRLGPPAARVDGVDSRELSVAPTAGRFEIRA